MISMQEIRKKYPQYNDLSDQQLADSLHTKFYADIPKEDFYQKIGFSIVPRESFESAFGDLRTPNEKISDFAQKYINDPIEAARAGVVRGLTGINQAIMKPADLLYGTNFVGEAQKGQQARDAQFEQQFGKENVGANLTRFLGEIAAPGGIGAKTIKWGQPVLKYLGKSALAGVPIGLTTYNPEGDQSFLSKGIGGAIAGGLTGGILKGGAALMPSKLFSKGVNKPDLARVNEALGDLETPLGDVLNSPTLKHVQENVLSHIPGSGVYSTAQRTNQAIEQEGKNILDNLKGDFDLSTTDARQLLQDMLTGRHEQVRQLKNKLYDAPNKLAENTGLKISPTQYQNEALNLLDEMATKNFPELADKSVEEFLIKAGTPKQQESFKNLNLVRGRLNKKIKESKAVGKLEEAGIYERLKNAIDRDREDAIAESGNNRLKNLFARAQKFYGKVYAPFKEKEISKFTKPGADSDLITNFFIRSGKGNRGSLATKLMSKLPTEGKKLLTYDYFSKAFTEDLGTGSLSFNPTKFANLYKNLGKSVRKAIFPDQAIRKQMENYALKVSRNKEGLGMMYNPKTGARIASMLVPGALGAIGGHAAGGEEGALGGTLAMLGAGAGGARVLNKLLTSPKIRKKLVEKILKPEKPSPGMGALVGALTSAESIGAQ